MKIFIKKISKKKLVKSKYTSVVTNSAAAADFANSLGTTDGATVGDLLTATMDPMALQPPPVVELDSVVLLVVVPLLALNNFAAVGLLMITSSETSSRSFSMTAATEEVVVVVGFCGDTVF